MKDKRWVILELSHLGEKENPSDFVSLIESNIDKDVEIFVPSASYWKYDNCVTVCLMEGYAFVEGGHPSSFYFTFEESPYISRVLTRDEPTGRFIFYLDNSEIVELKRKLREQTIRDLELGDFVKVVDGAYESLTGEIVGIDQETEKANVHVEELKSMNPIVVLPFVFLEKANKDKL